MSRDEIIRMAREATDHLPDADSIRMQGIVLLAFDAGAAAEREACAKVCEEHWHIEGEHAAYEFARAIRARSQQ